MPLIPPHGGKLIDRVLKGDAVAKGKLEAGKLASVQLSPREAGDLEMIAIGAFSPLEGFVGEGDFHSVCTRMRRASGTVWPIPVVLSPSDDVAAKINKGDRVALKQGDELLALMTVSEKYKHDKAVEIPNVYKTEDEAHPGVKIVKQQGSWCLAGSIDVITPNPSPEFPDFRLPPAKTREAVLHSLIRKNYGVTHFIVGRDHAGVGNYYGTYDAQTIFDQFDIPREIGITPLKFEHSSWCKVCEGMVSAKTCPHGPESKVHLSGTKVRDMLRAGERPPMEFSRPEVAGVLVKWAQTAGLHRYLRALQVKMRR